MGHVNDHAHGEHPPETSSAHIHATHEDSAHDHAAATDKTHEQAAEVPSTMSTRDTVITTAVTVGVVGVAAVVFEAALIPGMILGVAAALAPSYVPRMGAALSPLFRSTIRGAYKFGQKTREAASEVREQMSDIAAEVNAEGVSADKKAAAL
jgi:hypothetical protein